MNVKVVGRILEANDRIARENRSIFKEKQDICPEPHECTGCW